MSVFTFVQRALPFPLAWKRRPSASPGSKGKGKEDDFEKGFVIEFEPSLSSEKAFFETEAITAKRPSTSLPCDVSPSLQVAVKQSPDPATNTSNALSGSDSDIVSESHASHVRFPNSPDLLPLSPRPRLARVVSWASIVRSQCRWTVEQEKELVRAEKQLARCQRAWSSEQELWISYVCLYCCRFGRCLYSIECINNILEIDCPVLTFVGKVQELNEEKEAHEGFMLMRMKQQEDERAQFRKAWKRRRSVEDCVPQKQKSLIIRRNSSGLQKSRQIQHVYIAEGNMDNLAKAPVVACQS